MRGRAGEPRPYEQSIHTYMTNFISPPSPQTPIVPTPTPTTAPIVPTPTPSTPPPTPSTNPRKRLPIILGIIGALAVVGVITAAFVFLKTEPKENRNRRLRLRVFEFQRHLRLTLSIFRSKKTTGRRCGGHYV